MNCRIALDSIVRTIERVEPLSDDQILLLAGALCVWLQKERDEGYASGYDAAVTKGRKIGNA